MASSQSRVLVVGAGVTGQAHAKALIAHLGTDQVAVFAPSTKNREAVQALGVRFMSGELADAIREFPATHAVVVVPVDRLTGCLETLIASGLKQILVEKPGTMTSAEGRKVTDLATKAGARIHVAYNRRFFSSVREALRLIAASGETIEAVHCEFTEWAHEIETLSHHSAETKRRWLAANSLHPIDLAFFPVGLPKTNDSHFARQGSLSWHPSGSRFYGAGTTEKGALFDCHAHWAAPGRWRVEWLTPSTRYLFCPMEKLQIQKRGSVAITEVPLPDGELDQTYKPGFYLQSKAFLNGESSALCGWSEAQNLLALGERIGGYV